MLFTSGESRALSTACADYSRNPETQRYLGYIPLLSSLSDNRPSARGVEVALPESETAFCTPLADPAAAGHRGISSSIFRFWSWAIAGNRQREANSHSQRHCGIPDQRDRGPDAARYPDQPSPATASRGSLAGGIARRV